MPPKPSKPLPRQPWPERDIVALSPDGTVFLNARVLERPDLRALAVRRDVFVGIRLTPKELRDLRTGLYDGAAEASAFIAGRRWKRDKRRAERAAKRGA